MANITIGEARFSYVHLTKPYAHSPGQEEKYSVTVLLPKANVAMKAAIDAAIEEAKQRGLNDKWGGVAPKVIPVPIYDGDGVRSNGEEFGPECKGHWVFTARSDTEHRPEIVDENLQAIIDPTQIYSGMYGRVSVGFYPYNYAGKKGIGCSLGPVQKLRDGDALGGSVITAAQAFGSPAQPAGRVDPITGEIV